MSETYALRLSIHRLRLMVRLGYGEGEREAPQPVELDVRFFFTTRPAACDDETAPFLDYDTLSGHLAAYCADKEFRLIEFLAARLLEECGRCVAGTAGLPAGQVRVWLTLNKCAVPVEAIGDGCRVSLSDLPGGVPIA